MTVKEYRKLINDIKLEIELYNDCYEGTPDECIRNIKELIDGIQ